MKQFPDRVSRVVVLLVTGLTGAMAAPSIDPLPNVNLPAGRALEVPVIATSPNGRPLTYTVTSSTNRISVEVRTNNLFWRLSVAQVAPPGSSGAYETTFRGVTVRVTNVGDMTFMLFRDRAPRAVDAFVGLSHGGFFNSNTIFHRVITNFMIQGGDPATNGTGGPVFRYDDEFHPRSFFTGNGQLALANASKDANGSQFFVTFGPQRHLDFRHTIFGQLLRGHRVQTNIAHTLCDTNNRPLRDVIILRAAVVTNWTDTVVTLTASNQVGVSGTIRVIADDGAGGRATNTFVATTVAETVNTEPIIYPDTVTNRHAPANGRLTNVVTALDWEGDVYYWYTAFADADSAARASNSFASLLPTRQVQLVVVPNSNYIGPVDVKMVVSSSDLWGYWPDFFPADSQVYRFVFGDTEIRAWPTQFVAGVGTPFSNQVVAFFTNGVPGSPSGNFTASIHWGDNTTNNGVVVAAGAVKQVLGSHTYTSAGHYPVEVMIESVNGARTTLKSTALVPPALQLARAGNNNRITWPSWAPGFQVQSRTDLLAAPWGNVTNLPSLEEFDFVVTHQTTANAVFFRLTR